MAELTAALLIACVLHHLLLSPDAEQRSAQLGSLGIGSALLLTLLVPINAGLASALEAINARSQYLLLAVITLSVCAYAISYGLKRWRRLAEPLLFERLLLSAIVALAVTEQAQSLSQSLWLGLLSGTGLWLLLQLMHDWRVRLEPNALPAALRGAPSLLISAGLIGLALLGLNGMGAV